VNIPDGRDVQSSSAGVSFFSDQERPTLDPCTLLLSGPIPPDIEAELPPDGELATISPDFGRGLARLLLGIRPQSVLEFGAGASSLVISMALRAAGRGRLTSVEHAPRYSAAAWKRVEAVGVDAALIACPLALRPHSQGLIYQYQGIDRIKARAPFDFVLVDAPPGAFGRDAVLYQILPYLSSGALIVLDDAARVNEGTVINRWRRACEGLDIVCWNREYARGVAILRYGGRPQLRMSLRNVLGTCHDRVIYRRLVQILRRQDACEMEGT
jgi:predicted O-methyltransferase YrrM